MSVSQLNHYTEQEIQYLKEVAKGAAAFSARYFTGSGDRARPAAAQECQKDSQLGRCPATRH